MNIGGIDLNVGDRIEYTKHTPGSGYGAKTKQYSGVISHMTEKIITVDLGKYRDTFTINDLACGTIVIPGMKEIEITTSEINTPYRPLRSEMIRDTEAIMREEERLKKPIPKPSDEELRNVYSDGKQDIKFVQEFYGISKPVAKRWLKEAGLLEDKPKAKSQKAATTQQPEGVKAEPLSDNNPILTRKRDGTIDWDIMWPIVKAELDIGRDKYDVAEEYGISKASMKHQVQKHGGMKKLKATVKADSSPTPFGQYRSLSRDELLAIRANLQAEGELIDVILSCIDKTLEEARIEGGI